MSFEDFGSALLSSLTEQAGISENKPTNPNNPYDYSALGQFKNRIDQTAERRYVESGVKYNMRPRNLDIMMQEPDAVILVKKRQFSSLAENYRYDLMNQDEKNYIRATKRLFYNKCRQIAAYERLTKVEKIIKNNGGLNDSILPGILGSVELLNTLSPGLISGETLSSLELIKQIKNLSNNAENTSWINYNEIPYLTDVGDGTGVIELTLISSFSTQTSTKFDGGSLSAQIDDPYGMMIITSKDIEKAISDTVGFTNNLFFSGTNSILLDATNNAIEQLNSVRKIRGASRIIFKENESSILFKKSN